MSHTKGKKGKNMKKFHQLVATGQKALVDGTGKTHSQRIFDDRETALQFIPEFTKKVTSPKNKYDLQYLDNEGLKVSVVELEQ